MYEATNCCGRTDIVADADGHTIQYEPWVFRCDACAELHCSRCNAHTEKVCDACCERQSRDHAIPCELDHAEVAYLV